MKKVILSVVLIGIIGFVGLSIGFNSKESDEIVVGMSGGYKPYTFMDSQGELKGFDVDVWKEIGKRMDKKVSFQTSDFSGLFGKLDSKKINTIANQITITEDRLEKYYFTDPYVYYGAQLIVNESNDEIKDLESLKGKKVGVSLGSNYEKMVKEFDKNNEIEVITYENFQGSLQDVSNGRIDAVLNDRLAALTSIKESGLDIKLGGAPVKELHNAFPFVKEEVNKELINEINKAIESMYKDGTMEEISLKWFEVDITKNIGE